MSKKNNHTDAVPELEIETPKRKGGCTWKMAAGFGCTLTVVMVVVYVMGWGRAIPWGFGGWGNVENKSGRVPEFDQFLVDHAKVLNNKQAVKELLPKFVELSKTLETDSECVQYYTTVLMKFSEMGLDATMNQERNVINRNIAQSLTQDGSATLAYTMKKRHILDAFVDAASLHAWPHVKANLRQAGEL